MTNSLTIGSERLYSDIKVTLHQRHGLGWDDLDNETVNEIDGELTAIIKSDPGIVALVEFVEGLSNAKSFNIALGGADIPRMAAERLKTWETGK